MANLLEKFYQSKDSEELFKEWKSQEEARHCLEERFLYDEADLEKEWSQEFLEDHEEFGLDTKEYQKFLKNKKEEKIEQRSREWFDDRVSDVLWDVDSNYEYETDSKIKVYRKMTIEDVDSFLQNLEKNSFKEYSGIGVCWSFCPEKAESHWGGKGEKILLEGLIDEKEIDVETTFWLNMDMSCGEEEAEIRVNEKVLILIKNITLESGERIDINSTVFSS